MPRSARFILLIAPLLGGCADLARPTPIRIQKETLRTTAAIPPGGSRSPQVMRLDNAQMPAARKARARRAPAGTG